MDFFFLACHLDVKLQLHSFKDWECKSFFFTLFSLPTVLLWSRLVSAELRRWPKKHILCRVKGHVVRTLLNVSEITVLHHSGRNCVSAWKQPLSCINWSFLSTVEGWTFYPNVAAYKDNKVKYWSKLLMYLFFLSEGKWSHLILKEESLKPNRK